MRARAPPPSAGEARPRASCARGPRRKTSIRSVACYAAPPARGRGSPGLMSMKHRVLVGGRRSGAGILPAMLPRTSWSLSLDALNIVFEGASVTSPSISIFSSFAIGAQGGGRDLVRHRESRPGWTHGSAALERRLAVPTSGSAAHQQLEGPASGIARRPSALGSVGLWSSHLRVAAQARGGRVGERRPRGQSVREPIPFRVVESQARFRLAARLTAPGASEHGVVDACASSELARPVRRAPPSRCIPRRRGKARDRLVELEVGRARRPRIMSRPSDPSPPP